MPTLVIHGDDDQIVPIEVGGPGLGDARRRAPSSRSIPGAPHGITDTHKEELNADLLAFVQGVGSASPVAAESI